MLEDKKSNDSDMMEAVSDCVDIKKDGPHKYDFTNIIQSTIVKKKWIDVSEGNNSGTAGIFLVLSIFKEGSIGKIADYEVDYDSKYDSSEGNKRIYKGEQTNDAPVQYLIDEAYGSGYDLRKIVCINTPEALEDPKSGVSSYKRFSALVKEYARTTWGKEIEVDSIQYIQHENEDKKYLEFYQQLNIQAEGLDTFFIDYTGGFRDTSFLMVAAMRFLEFKGIKCEKVIYSDYAKKQLKNLDKAYGLFQMISGMNEFVSSGTSRQLDKAFSGQNRLTQAIRKFSHSTNVGDMENLDKRIEELNAALIENENEKDINSIMLRSMSDVIKEKIFGVGQGDNLISANGDIDYLRLIEWCIKNKMYQQAATLYIEKVPVAYWRKGIINNLTTLNEKPKMGASKETATFYGNLPQALVHGYDIADLCAKISTIVAPDKEDWNSPNNRTKTRTRDSFYNDIRKLLAEYSADVPNRLIGIVKNTYPNYKKVQDIPVHARGTDNPTQNDLEKFINYIGGSSIWPIHYYILHGSTALYPQPYKGMSDKQRTMTQIQDIYDRADTNPKTNDDKALCILMALYLAIKLLRNKMSHAVEDVDIDGELVKKELENFFRTALTDVSLCITLDERDIDALLSAAIKHAKSAKVFSRYEEPSEEDSNLEVVRIAELQKEINDIQIPNIEGDVTENFIYYVKILIYVMSTMPGRKGSLSSIKERVPGEIELPEKRTLSKEGKKSGIKLIQEYCSDFIRVEGSGENAVLSYTGSCT